MDYSFRHLDPSVTKTYKATVLYGFELELVCFYIKVKNGYVVETPKEMGRAAGQMGWIRGQHISTLEPYFKQIKPIRLIAGAY